MGTDRVLVQVRGFLSGTEATFRHPTSLSSPLNPEWSRSAETILHALFHEILSCIRYHGGRLSCLAADRAQNWRKEYDEERHCHLQLRSPCNWWTFSSDLDWVQSWNVSTWQYIWLGRDPLILGKIYLQKPRVFVKWGFQPVPFPSWMLVQAFLLY